MAASHPIETPTPTGGRVTRSLARHRSIAQLLHRPRHATVASVVRHQLAVQAQDYRCARLAMRARTRGTTVADVDRALTEDRSVLITWLNRGTLHLVDREDYPWLLGLTAPGLMNEIRRRLDREGVSPTVADRAVTIIDRALADEGPLTRHELGARLTAAGLGDLGSGTIQVLFLTGVLGKAIRGPVVDGQQRYARAQDWLGIPPSPPLQGARRDRALAELARRYLRGHGPASDRDLATWAGLPLRDARAGLGAIARELVEVTGDLVDVRRADDEGGPGRVPTRLVPMWDEMLVGWKDRAVVIPERHREGYGTNMNGMIRAIVCVGGQALGTWGIRRDRGTATIDVTPFERLSATTAAAVQREVADIARFEQLTLRVA